MAEPTERDWLEATDAWRESAGPGCERHRGDPHNLCEACWALEPDTGPGAGE